MPELVFTRVRSFLSVVDTTAAFDECVPNTVKLETPTNVLRRDKSTSSAVVLVTAFLLRPDGGGLLLHRQTERTIFLCFGVSKNELRIPSSRPPVLKGITNVLHVVWAFAIASATL
jgi:uncharacterized phage protein gp47/JayE